MRGFCSTPGHHDLPARLYPAGWLCGGCAPGSLPQVTTGETA